MTYDEFDCEFDDLLSDFRQGHISEVEFHKQAEVLQNHFEEYCDE